MRWFGHRTSGGEYFHGVWSLDGSDLPKLNQTVTVEEASRDGWWRSR